MEAPPKLCAEALTVRYGARVALDGVSLSIAPREVTALIGPSGCGKSTFLRAFNRMNDGIAGFALSGRVLLDGGDVYARGVHPVALRRRVGMVFQRPQPFPKSVFDNVAYGPRAAGVRIEKVLRERVERALRRAALWDEVKDRLDEHATKLSGGQAQRLCIARALAVGPEVLLMDEPTGSLDPTATARIEALIGELRRELTIVFVTHSMPQAARVSQSAAFFLQGKLVEANASAELFTRPGERQTADYIAGRFG